VIAGLKIAPDTNLVKTIIAQITPPTQKGSPSEQLTVKISKKVPKNSAKTL
jgi:hypothetical protein